MRRPASSLAVSVVLMLAACGGGDDDASSDAPVGGDESAAADPAVEPAPSDATPASSSDEPSAESTSGADGRSDAADPEPSAAGEGSATVTLDGETYSFALVEPGPADEFYSFCTTVAGSLQAVLQQVDENGDLLGGELSVILLEPGGAFEQTGDPPEVYVNLAEGRGLSNIDGEAIDAPADGDTGGGTVTLTEQLGFGDDGTLDTADVEATIQVSC